VLLSTVKVNGDRTTGAPFREEDPPAPKEVYAASKWEAEQRVRAVAARGGMACTVVRTPLVYGPRVRANFLGLLRLVDRGVPLPFGRVRNARSLVFVHNLADALLHCAARTEASDETYFVKDGPDPSTPELVRRIAAALGRAPRLVSVPPTLLRGAARLLGRGDVADRLLGSLVVSDARLRERTGWRPPHTMDEGLRETARWYRSARAGGEDTR